MNTRWWEIYIYDCYSLVKITFASIRSCKNNRRIWRYNASTPCSRDVTDQLWRRHNAMSEKTVLNDNAIDNSLHERHKLIHSAPWITIFRSLVTLSLVKIIASLVTQKSLFKVTHTWFYISIKLQPKSLWPSETICSPRSRSTLIHIIFLSDATKTLPEPLLTYHQWRPVVFKWGQRHLSLE